MNNQLKLLTTTALLGVSTSAIAAPEKATDDRLNVILILSDDLGYPDVGYVGNPDINTPNLDRLSAQSLKFDNFHTASSSSPTRSGLMTGHNCNATGAWHTILGRSILSDEEYTIANAFQDSGYRTAMFGKWHLGDNYPYRPIDRGFEDVLYAKSSGPGQLPDYWGNNYYDDVYYRNDDIEEQQYGYCTEIWFNEAQRFITQHKDEPFFCYLALNSAHAPHHIDERYAEPYRSNPNVTNPAIYGMATNIDENVGRLLSSLERLGLDENTVVIYLGDNGSAGTYYQTPEGINKKGFDGGLRGHKCLVYEGGHRQSMIMRIPGVTPKMYESLATYVDIMPTLISLCDLTPTQEIREEGVDFLAEDYTGIDRTFVIDTQREELLKKYAMSCVIKNDWRLINGNELYDMASDRRQQRDLSDKYPEIVKELQAEYEKWWDEQASLRADEHQFIPIVAPNHKYVVMNCQDLHDETNSPNLWHQTHLRNDKMRPAASGFWAITVPKSGKYNIEVLRWSPDSGLAFNETAPKGRPVPNGYPLPECPGVNNVEHIILKIDGEQVASITDPDLSQLSVPFKGVKLPKGNHRFQALLTDSEGNKYSAWFLRFSE